MTDGGLLSTATVGGLMPASASEESRRSSEMVRIEAVNCVCSSATYAAPLLGRVGKAILEILRFLNVTVRSTLATRVRAVAKITPKVSAFAPVGLIARAARKLS